MSFPVCVRSNPDGWPGLRHFFEVPRPLREGGQCGGSGYGVTEFRDDLRKVLLDAGCLDKPLVFMLNDTQIAHEQFLEDVNNILNTGEACSTPPQWTWNVSNLDTLFVSVP